MGNNEITKIILSEKRNVLHFDDWCSALTGARRAEIKACLEDAWEEKEGKQSKEQADATVLSEMILHVTILALSEQRCMAAFGHTVKHVAAYELYN